MEKQENSDQKLYNQDSVLLNAAKFAAFYNLNEALDDLYDDQLQKYSGLLTLTCQGTKIPERLVDKITK